MKKLPTISVVIPTYNEEKNIKRCLDSVFSQNYPKSLLEVIVVDDNSTDRTINIVKQYPVKLLSSGKRHGEISKMLGFRKARGELFMYLDADIALRGVDWFIKMLEPLNKHQNLAGSFTRYFNETNSPAIERYLNFDPLQRDQIYQYFSPTIESTIVKKTKNYWLCRYNPHKILPAGLCLYRKNLLVPFIKDFEMFLELDFIFLLVKSGHTDFAYVPTAGLFHRHVESLVGLLKKRQYNLKSVYLARDKRFYKWFDTSSVFGIIKIIFWIIYANLVFPSLVTGIIKTIKYRDFAGLFEPIVNLMVTDLLIYNFMTSGKINAVIRQ